MLKKFLLVFSIITLVLTGCASKTNNKDNQQENNVGTENKEQKENTSNDMEKVEFNLSDGKGKDYSIKDFKGKLILLNFWGTWCGYCVEEMPILQKVHEKHGEKLAIVTVNVQSERERPLEEVIKWLNDKGYTFTNLFDDGTLANELNISGFPTTFLLDENGVLITKIPGAMTEEMMDELIDQLF